MTKPTTSNNSNPFFTLSPKTAFVLVSLCLGQLGDGLNIFQGIYLVGIGWNEGSVGAALSLMGLTALVVQPFAGDWVDKATVNRRVFLTVAAIVTAFSASTILRVKPGNHVEDHYLIYGSKIVEGIASSFIGPCLAALTLASFGPNRFDAVMASNLFWGHIGSVFAAILAGFVAYCSYPDIKYCFLVIGASALAAVSFIPSLPEGDPLLGRGFQGKPTESDSASSAVAAGYATPDDVPPTETAKLTVSPAKTVDSLESDQASDSVPAASTYLEVFFEYKTCILCFTGFFFHFANANVLLVLGELMGSGNDKDAGPTRTVIPFTAGAIVTAQCTMAIATMAGDRLTGKGIGRKPLFMAAIMTLPIRCALIIFLKDAGNHWLLSTQIFDGIGGGLFALIHPYLIADITFGTGRFNVVMGLTASFFGMGATLSNFLGQMVVERYGHIASLVASLLISAVPIMLFSNMPETLGCRGGQPPPSGRQQQASYQSVTTIDV